MNLRYLSAFFFFAVAVSLGYGASPGGGTYLDEVGGNPSSALFDRAAGFNKSTVVVNPLIPGNAIEGVNSGVPINSAIAAPVPEPSTIALVCVSLLGVAALKLRRRH